MRWDGFVPVTEHDLSAFPPQPRLRIRPARIPYWDDDLRTNRRHTFGFSVSCSLCDEKQLCASYPMAQAWKREHAKTHLGFAPLSLSGPLPPRPLD